jgi:hypothetical protein
MISLFVLLLVQSIIGDWEEPPDMEPVVHDLIEMLKEYVVELEDERNRP